jgi:hypothetical protein
MSLDTSAKVAGRKTSKRGESKGMVYEEKQHWNLTRY